MPLNLNAEQKAEFERLRNQWYAVMQPFEGFVPSNFLEKIPDFLPSHICQARLLPNRESVISFLPKNGIVAEIGTQEGVFAHKLYNNLMPEELHLFDIDFAPFHASGVFDVVPSNVTQHLGNSSEKMETMPDAYFDVIYIDGDHSYNGVKRDAEVSKRKLKPNGVLWFNDFTLWSPVEMIDYGVPHVVSELCHSGEWQIEFLALHPLFYHDVVLRRICNQNFGASNA